MSIQFLENLPKARAAGQRAGITSVCSAHPVVIRAALRHGLADDAPVLIEATCNQVNQDGGYTGMTPTDFRAFVEREAAQVGFPNLAEITSGPIPGSISLLSKHSQKRRS